MSTVYMHGHVQVTLKEWKRMAAIDKLQDVRVSLLRLLLARTPADLKR